MADEPIIKGFLALLRTQLKPLMHRSDEDAGVGYADTREPIEYDYHMPPTLRLAHIRHDPTLSLRLEQNLVDTLAQRTSVEDGSMDLTAIEAAFIRPGVRNLVPREAVAEACVRDLQRDIYKITGALATLVCFDVDNNELRDFRYVFSPFNSDEPNTKGDILIGCQTREDDGPEEWGSLWSPLTEARNICDPYFRVLHTEETKNIRSGNPRTILGISVIIWCLEKGYLKTVWPRNDCEGCAKFRKSHLAADSSKEQPDELPIDGQITTEALIPTTNMKRLRDEIFRLVDLAGLYQARYNIPAEEKRTVRKPKPKQKQSEAVAGPKPVGKPKKKVKEDPETDVSDPEEFMEYAHLLEKAMNKAVIDLKLPADITEGLLRWVVNGAYMLIQVWAHMVRHNATIAHLTSYNLGVVMTRHRKTQSLSVSAFVEHTDAPILRATALTVYAYNDAVERYDEHLSQDVPFWIKDPYRGETKAAQAAQKAAEKIAAAAKRKGKGDSSGEESDEEDTDEANGDPHESDDEGDDHDGPSGNNVGGRGGASGGGSRDHSGSEPGPSGGGGGSGPQAGGLPRRSNRFANHEGSQLELNAVHLAFKAPEKHLWSTGFSHFTRLGFKAAPEITPVQEFPPVSFQATARLGAFLPEYPSDQRRRESGGSTRSSVSSASTGPSGPSLFSETSSPPTSPSTTVSFTHTSSRDSSPFPEKASHDGSAHPRTSATSVCDAAGIIIDGVLGESAIGTVWSGKLIPEDDSDDDHSIAIAVKMAIAQDNDEEGWVDPRDAIRWETSVYDLLVKSGKQAISPRYYGAFEDRLGTVALVLDNAGTTLPNFKAAKKPFRQALLAKAVEMHSAGIYHNDLVPRNIVQDSEGELRIIDFHIAELDHRCRGEDKCEELVAFRAALGL